VRAAERKKRLGDRHRAKREIRVRSDQLGLDPLAGERMQRQHCFRPGDATAADDALHLTNIPWLREA
jgi:hypothetical protein